MAKKIASNDLQKLLKTHLIGTALQEITERNDFVSGADGFVLQRVIDNIIDACKTVLRIHQGPNPYRQKKVAKHIPKIEAVIAALRSYTDTPDFQQSFLSN